MYLLTSHLQHCLSLIRVLIVIGRFSFLFILDCFFSSFANATLSPLSKSNIGGIEYMLLAWGHNRGPTATSYYSKARQVIDPRTGWTLQAIQENRAFSTCFAKRASPADQFSSKDLRCRSNTSGDALNGVREQYRV